MSDAFIGSRLDYARQGLDRSDLHENPVEMLRIWLLDAEREGVVEPSAMSLATVAENGQPSVRMVLLRSLDDRGLVFYTNYLSRKGRELAGNPFAAVCFWWQLLERQVRVEGSVERVPDEESDAYFRARPSGSKRASAASPQSQVIASRQDLDAVLASLPENVERPANWGGYVLLPTAFEFWQGRPARLHDRFRFERAGTGWNIARLAP